MPRADETQFLHNALKGHAQAIEFCQLVFRLSQVIDDLYDRDREVAPAEIHRMAWDALVELPSQPFYQRHFAYLQPLVRSALIDWMDSCTLERGNHHHQSIAFVLRDSVGGLVSHCAYLVGGYAWMRQVSPAIRDHIFEEDLESYVHDLNMEGSP